MSTPHIRLVNMSWYRWYKYLLHFFGEINYVSILSRVTCYMWHVTCEVLCVACDLWHVKALLSIGKQGTKSFARDFFSRNDKWEKSWLPFNLWQSLPVWGDPSCQKCLHIHSVMCHIRKWLQQCSAVSRVFLVGHSRQFGQILTWVNGRNDWNVSCHSFSHT